MGVEALESKGQKGRLRQALPSVVQNTHCNNMKGCSITSYSDQLSASPGASLGLAAPLGLCTPPSADPTELQESRPNLSRRPTRHLCTPITGQNAHGQHHHVILYKRQCQESPRSLPESDEQRSTVLPTGFGLRRRLGAAARFCGRASAGKTNLSVMGTESRGSRLSANLPRGTRLARLLINDARNIQRC